MATVFKVWGATQNGDWNYPQYTRYFTKKEFASKFIAHDEYGKVKQFLVISSDDKTYIIEKEIEVDKCKEFDTYSIQEKALQKLSAEEKKALGL